jgi:hypothetical protein
MLQNEISQFIVSAGSRNLYSPSSFEPISVFLSGLTEKIAILPTHSIAKTYEAFSWLITDSMPDFRGDVEEILSRVSLRISVGLPPFPDSPSTLDDLRGCLSDIAEGETDAVEEVRRIRDNDEIE